MLFKTILFVIAENCLEKNKLWHFVAGQKQKKKKGGNFVFSSFCLLYENEMQNTFCWNIKVKYLCFKLKLVLSVQSKEN